MKLSLAELDDLDSAIVDARNAATNYGNRVPLGETAEYVARLDALQERIAEWMNALAPTEAA